MNTEPIINFLEENNISNSTNLAYLEMLRSRVERIINDQQYVDDCNYLNNFIEIYLDMDCALYPFDVKDIKTVLDKNKIQSKRILIKNRGKYRSNHYDIEGNEFNIINDNGFYDLKIRKINR